MISWYVDEFNKLRVFDDAGRWYIELKVNWGRGHVTRAVTHEEAQEFIKDCNLKPRGDV